MQPARHETGAIVDRQLLAGGDLPEEPAAAVDVDDATIPVGAPAGKTWSTV